MALLSKFIAAKKDMKNCSLHKGRCKEIGLKLTYPITSISRYTATSLQY
jgi:hypothetical protein